MMESGEFKKWYLKEFNAKIMPRFEDGGYPTSQRAHATWKAWCASQKTDVQVEPMFWVRICSDGLYEGPIHNARIEEVRKQSGAWSPLFLKSPEPQQAAPGWQLVPIEPTPEMLDRGAHANSEWLDDMAPLHEGRYRNPARSVYATMLQAAPKAKP